MRFATLVYLLYLTVRLNALLVMPKEHSIAPPTLFRGKMGRLASEEVILQLLQSRCIPVLIYRVEAFALSTSDLRSLDFTVNRFFMKLFKTSNVLI